jgi:hypothetical protein
MLLLSKVQVANYLMWDSKLVFFSYTIHDRENFLI